MIGAYEQAAQAWTAAGIVPLPLGGEDGKRPLVKHPEKFGRRAALQIAPKYPDANLGFWCGRHNGVTVVDIDSTSDAELQHAINTYGDSPVIVRTATGKAHVYYRHSGERRRIRPDKGHPVDLLGEGGLAVAPPSLRPARGRYEFVRGGLDDFHRLPTIRPGAVAQLESVGRRARLALAAAGVEETAERAEPAQPGRRNDTMFRLACELAQAADNRDVLLDQVRRANAELPVPLPDAELQRAVASAWKYRDEGRLMVPGGESAIVLPRETVGRLLAAGETDVLALLTLARKAHGAPGRVFALSPAAMERARVIGSWDRKRYRNAIRRAMDLGELVETHRGGRGPNDPSQYRLQKGGRFALQS